jgi:hypothetical protein
MLNVKRTVAKPLSVERSLRRLAAAVLVQALQDASGGSRRSREDVWEWFDNRSQGQFTFEFCCSLLGRDPEDVRHRLQKSHFMPKPVQSATLAYPSRVNSTARIASN